MSAEDADRLRGVLQGTALKMPVMDITCTRNQVEFPNSGGMLANSMGIYGDVRILCDVDIYLAGETAFAVATMPGGGKGIIGRVTVGIGKTVDVKPATHALLSGRGDFTEYFEPVFYSHVSK